ncbi:MAG: mandelate racemase/muconate lactonizing enzyme family protein [Candidatus Limnocylindrus sp.]
MTAQISSTVHRLTLRNPWNISHGRSLARETVIVHLGSGLGEAAIVPYLGGSAHDVQQELAATEGDPLKDLSVDSIPTNSSESTAVAVHCALDLARYDLAGRDQRRPLWDLLGLSVPRPMETSISIAMDTPDRMAALAQSARASMLKVKVGGDHDEEAIEAIRGVTTASLRLDANGGWTRERAAHLIPRLARFDVELIEQPLAASDRYGFAWLAAQNLGVPIFADESVATVDDIDRLAHDVDGVVIKLRKFGGITASLEGIARARRLGKRVMMGCMIESSVATTAAAHLGGLCDLVDLDSPLLISNDPYEGIRYEGSICHVPDLPGIGVSPRPTSA